MPKLKTTHVPKPHHHRASGQARIRLGGKDTYLGPWGSPEAERRYQQFLSEWAAAKPGGPAPPPAAIGITVTVAVHRFWRWAQERYRHPDGSATCESENYKHALRPLRRLFGELPLGELGPSKLYEVQAAMVAEGLARQTVNARVARIRRFARWCVGRELAKPDLLAGLQAVKPVHVGGAREAPPRRPVAGSDVEATLLHLPAILQSLVLVLWHTGARVGEGAALTTGMLD
jgi:integrase